MFLAAVWDSLCKEKPVLPLPTTFFQLQSLQKAGAAESAKDVLRWQDVLIGQALGHGNLALCPSMKERLNKLWHLLQMTIFARN